MPETFARWDAADYIRDKGSFLEACIAEDPGDGSVIRAGLGAVARAQNMSSIAKDTGLDRAGLYRALSERGNPSFTSVLKVTRALGLRLRLEPVETAVQTVVVEEVT